MVGVLGTVGRKTRRAAGVASSPDLPAPVFRPTDCELRIFVVNFVFRDEHRFEEALCLG
jgi:hypothetical protein